MSSEPVISVQGLSKCYNIYDHPRDRLLQMLCRGRRQYFREFWALHNVSFDIPKGQTVGIIGRNGSGKSTLLQLICGTLHPTEGSIVTRGRIAALLELGSGFNPEFTGRENVFLNAALFGLSRAETQARFADIVAFADIGEFIDQPIKSYSSGMMVRLAFAVIAHVDADILVIDEALAVGDAFFTQKCMRFLRTFQDRHSLLFVSHDTASVINLCDRAIWLDHGRVHSAGNTKDVCEEYLNCLFQSMEDNVSPRPAQPPVERIARLCQPELAWNDPRTDLIASSTVRNDIEVFTFAPEASGSYGGQEARIHQVQLLDSTGARLSRMTGGEKVCLRIEIQTFVPLESPIVGFFVKDRLGQTLFGDNTHISYMNRPCLTPANGVLTAEFVFFMPWLGQGDYTIQAAVAEGNQNSHRQLHWLHDALTVRSHHSPVSTGIIGLPMCDIRLSSS